MNEKVSNNENRSWLKGLWIVLLAFGAVVLVIRLSLKTDFVRDIVKGQIVRAANDQLTVSLDIGKLEGDLWHEFMIRDLVVHQRGDTLASADAINGKFDIWSYFSSQFQISSLSIINPYLKFREQDGEFNVTSWYSPSPDEAAPFTFVIADFSLNGGRIDALIQSLPKDSSIVLSDIQVASKLSLETDSYTMNISNLSFRIQSTRLEEPITLDTRLEASSEAINLEKLVLATGRSMLTSSGNFNPDDRSATFSLEAQPLSWRDLAAYVEDMPVKNDLSLELELSGNLSRFQVGLGIESAGIEALNLDADFSWDSTLALHRLQAESKKLDFQQVMGQDEMPVLTDLKFSTDGRISFDDYRNGNLSGSLNIGNFVYSNYEVEQLNGTFSLKDGMADAEVNFESGPQWVKSTADVQSLWSAAPKIQIALEGRNIDPAYWSKDPAYGGNISLNGSLSGVGLEIGSQDWQYEFQITGGHIGQQKFTSLKTSGTFSDRLITNNSSLRLFNNEVNINGRVRDYSREPRFSYDFSTRGFNIGVIHGIEGFTTDLNIQAKGEGRGSDLETLQLNSEVRIDSSLVNGELVRFFSANVSVNDITAQVDSAKLSSTIADGSFDGRIHLQQMYNPENELNFNLDIKDIKSLAPLVEMDEIGARGTVAGRLFPVDERLQFNGNVKLEDLEYGDIFKAAQANGAVEVQVTEYPEYTLDVDLDSPLFYSVLLHDLSLNTSGKMTPKENQLNGRFTLNFSSANEEVITHSGDYQIREDSTTVTTDVFNLRSSARTLSLVNPFRVSIANSSVRMDTMRLQSNEPDDNAQLVLAVPYADSTRQRAFLEGHNLNLTVIQNTLLSETYFDGMLSGSLQMDRTDTSLVATGDLTLTDLVYREGSVESMKLKLDIKDERLIGSMSITDDGDELVTGNLHLPFVLGDPSTFGEAFYDEEVSGNLKVKQVALNRFRNLMAGAGMVETSGILDLEFSMEGKAGDPDLKGNMVLSNASLSGVKVDSVIGEMNYDHDKSHLKFSASISSLKQKLAEIRAEAPFYVNVREAEITLPSANDSIAVDVTTNNFNLAALNDFVDRSRVRQIKGEVNGMVHIMGIIDDLQAKGAMRLREGSLRIVQAGITVDNISSRLVFDKDVLRVDSFSGKSGNGTLTANGRMAIEKLVPGSIDLVVKANNFKAANTTDYNAIIDLSTEITGSLTKPVVKGKLSVQNGFIQLDNFGEKSVEDVQLYSSEPNETTFSIYDSLSLDMDLSFNRRFFIRNQRYLELQMELEGGVDMIKNPSEDLQMFGTVSTASGYARPLGKRFELEEGEVTFNGPADNPRLNIRTLFIPPQPEEEIRIWYIIEGTVEDPQFKYESDPPMELENIISYTLFGQPFYSLDSWKQVVASSGSNASATDLALDILLDRVETLATQKLGIDVVRIDNTRISGETGTVITTGWYISPKVFFAIQNVITGSTPDTGFLLEYRLKKNLRLIISQGNDSRQGVDLKWNYDY